MSPTRSASPEPRAEDTDTVGDCEVLAAVEDETTVWVAWAGDPEAWVVRLEKSRAFPARDWADRMCRLYGRRHPPAEPHPVPVAKESNP